MYPLFISNFKATKTTRSTHTPCTALQRHQQYNYRGFCDTTPPRIADLLRETTIHLNRSVIVSGWIRGLRQQKESTFVDVNDGSSVGHLQIVLSKDQMNEDITFGSSIEVEGILSPSMGSKQKVELKPNKVTVLGKCNPSEYPIQVKHHPTVDFLREIAHLRPRTNFFGSVLRMRSASYSAMNEFLQEQGFIQVHTPVITSSDCEGGGQAFRISVDGMKEEYFGKPSYLTVSGQLHGEMLACALGKVYTFGPTFRVEGTDTPRHLSEFLMLEPEMSFCDLSGCMDVTEKLIKFSVQKVLDKCKEEIDFFSKRVDESLPQRIRNTLETKYERITYKEALSILDKATKKGEKFQFPITYGSDLQREHERYLCDTYFQKPVFVIDWPRDLKAFYMRQNTDGQTVAAMDLLVPTVGEIAGGSAREERYDILAQALEKRNLLNDNYNWYLDLRKYGTVPHAGFGLGFERFIQYITGVKNIKDVIPVPRYPGACKY